MRWVKVGASWEYRNERGQTCARVSPTRSGWRWESYGITTQGGYLRFAIIGSGTCPGGAGKEGASFAKAKGRAESALSKN